MKIVKLLSIALALTISLGACAPMGARTDSVVVDVPAGQFEVTQAPVLSRHRNSVDLLYYDVENRLVLRSEDGTQQVLSEGNEKNARRSFNVLQSDGDWRYVLWRPKLINATEGLGAAGDKFVYFRASPDGGKSFGPIQRLNKKGGAFKPVMATGGNGAIYVAYADERNDALNYDIYLNASQDHGATWMQEDIKLNGAESKMSLDPSVVADGDHAHVSWMTRGTDGNFRIFVRTTDNRGKSWNAPVAAYNSAAQPGSSKLIKVAKGLMLCWSGVDATRCTTSTDYARSWSEAVVLPDSASADGLVLEVDAQGRAHLLMAKKTSEEKSKVNLFHAMSKDDYTFTAPQRISGGEAHKSSTILPTLTFGDDGSVLAVWVDFRHFIPAVFANYSTDGGISWQADGFALAAEKGMYNFFPSVAWGNGSYQIAWQKALDRSKPSTLVSKTRYRLGAPGVAMPAPDMARLSERVNSFWSLREQKKWAEIYKLLDPFFRDGNSDSAYIKSQGSVVYYNHSLPGKPVVNGSRAMVPVTYDSEVPEVVIRGKPISVPRQEVTIQQEWIWVAGDWYQVFRDNFGGSTVLE